MTISRKIRLVALPVLLFLTVAGFAVALILAVQARQQVSEVQREVRQTRCARFSRVAPATFRLVPVPCPDGQTTGKGVVASNGNKNPSGLPTPPSGGGSGGNGNGSANSQSVVTVTAPNVPAHICVPPLVGVNCP